MQPGSLPPLPASTPSTFGPRIKAACLVPSPRALQARILKEQCPPSQLPVSPFKSLVRARVTAATDSRADAKGGKERKQKTPLTLARLEIPPLQAHELLIKNVAVAQAPGGVSVPSSELWASHLMRRWGTQIL